MKLEDVLPYSEQIVQLKNVIIATTQCFLRADGDDEFAGEKSHRYGASTTNQRVEAWWSYLRRSRLTWWINFFKDLINSGTLLSDSMIHEECLWFCFAEIIQKDQGFVCLHWNMHYIRKSGHNTVPGKPEELYSISWQLTQMLQITCNQFLVKSWKKQEPNLKHQIPMVIKTILMRCCHFLVRLNPPTGRKLWISFPT